MNVLGAHLTLLIGPEKPVPAPRLLSEALHGVTVTQQDEGRSGFEITFQVGRGGAAGVLNYPVARHPLLKPFNRVILVVRFNLQPRVLMDGFITNHQLQAGSEPGSSTFTITGEDVSVMMDMEERIADNIGVDERQAAQDVLNRYTERFRLVPTVLPLPVYDPADPLDGPIKQHGTDLDFLNTLAGRHGYVFYVEPGKLPGTNVAYWGPPKRTDLPQRALSVNMGPGSNVESINFRYDGLAPTTVAAREPVPFETLFSIRPPLSRRPAIICQQPHVRRRLLPADDSIKLTTAWARAQGITDASVDNVVTATGELDAVRYGESLRARRLVGLRGAGLSYDGLYYVKSVTHNIRKGEYKQQFTLTREGLGTSVPVVRP